MEKKRGEILRICQIYQFFCFCESSKNQGKEQKQQRYYKKIKVCQLGTCWWEKLTTGE